MEIGDGALVVLRISIYGMEFCPNSWISLTTKFPPVIATVLNKPTIG